MAAAAAGDGSQVRAPTLIEDSPDLQGWHLLDVSFGQPRAVVCLQLNSPVADASARGAALLRLLLEALELAVAEERDLAEEGGLGLDMSNYCMASPCRGLRLLAQGYSDKLPLLLANVLRALAGLEVPPERFAMARERAVTDYRNRRFQQPYSHALTAGHAVLESPYYSRWPPAGVRRLRRCSDRRASAPSPSTRICTSPHQMIFLHKCISFRFIKQIPA